MVIIFPSTTNSGHSSQPLAWHTLAFFNPFSRKEWRIRTGTCITHNNYVEIMSHVSICEGPGEFQKQKTAGVVLHRPAARSVRAGWWLWSGTPKGELSGKRVLCVNIWRPCPRNASQHCRHAKPSRDGVRWASAWHPSPGKVILGITFPTGIITPGSSPWHPRSTPLPFILACSE